MIYTEMHSLCPSMRLREIPQQGQIFFGCRKSSKIMKFQCFSESIRTLLEYFLDVRRVILEVREHPGWNSEAVWAGRVFDILTPKMLENDEIRGKFVDDSLFDEKL